MSLPQQSFAVEQRIQLGLQEPSPTRPSCRHRLLTWLGPFRPTLLILGVAIAVFTVMRLCLLMTYADVKQLGALEWINIFFVGFQFDLLIGLCLILWQTLHIAALSRRWAASRFNQLLIESEWVIAFVFLPLLFLVEWLFFNEFDSRLNYIAFEYLVYPTEVCCNIWESYSVIPWLSAVVLTGGGGYLLLRQRMRHMLAEPLKPVQRCAIPTAVMGAIAILWVTTSMEDRNVTEDRVGVECAGNGIYSFVYHAWTCHFPYNENYVTLDDATAFRQLKNEVVQPGDRIQHGSSNPVDRLVTTGRPARDWNVVLILEESFGSDFIGALGDRRGLTPHFDELTREGILCDNVFATGNRTARALEAVLTSMPPLPTESILKRDRSDRVYTLAHVLAKRGYERIFMTGGRGLFDGVREFMTDNGFDNFSEQADYENPDFTNAWGVSDEDLFESAIEECDRLHELNKPFFAMLLTVSNHRPYTYPAGRIPQTEQTRENAVRYADWALGEFFREARHHDFYDDTLFIVMGDHGARVYGSQQFPMESYRVPVLIISPDGADSGERCHTLACSLDITPTIMGRLGGSYRSVFFGHDLLTVPPNEGRAIMQHNHDVAMLNANDQMVVLGFNHRVSSFNFNPRTLELKRSPQPNKELLLDAMALFQSAYDLYYSKRWYPDHEHMVHAR